MATEESLSYLPEPPTEPLPTDCCGTGCSPCVMDLHQEEMETWRMLSAMTPGERASWRRSKLSMPTKLECALSTSEYRACAVMAVQEETVDSSVYTIALPSGRSLGYQPGQHCVLRAKNSKGDYISRQYTPISPPDRIGSFDVLIKVYSDGEMSQTIDKWGVGTVTEWKGMFGGITYTPDKRLGLIACGTGVAPMVQVIRTIIENAADETLIHLLYCCQDQHRIPLKPLLSEYSSYWNCRVTYILSQATQADIKTNPGMVNYGDTVCCGKLDCETVCKEMPEPSLKNCVLICGTKSFDKDIINYLSRNGYTKQMYHRF